MYIVSCSCLFHTIYVLWRIAGTLIEALISRVRACTRKNTIDFVPNWTILWRYKCIQRITSLQHIHSRSYI